MKIPASISLKRLLYNKKFLVILSVVLAIIVWFIAMIERNPVREQVFTDIPVAVNVENTVIQELGLGIVSDVTSHKFTVTVSGPNYIVSSLKSEDFLLNASVADVTSPGKYSLTVTGNRNSKITGYEFVSISPQTIDVTFDYIDTKEFTIVPKLIGVSAEEGLVADTPIVSDLQNSTVSVKGPRTVMEKIASVGAYATVNKKIESTQTFDSEIVLLDKDENIIYRYSDDGKIYDGQNNLIENNYFTLDFTTVKVTQPILKKVTLKVVPTFNNVPVGIDISSMKYTVDHTNVSVLGAPDVVTTLSSLSLAPIDMRNISPSSQSFDVSAVLPDGVRMLDSIESFTVKIDTSAYAVKTFTISNMKPTGLAGDISLKNSTSVKNVKICGPKDVISKLTAEDLYASFVLTDKPAGQHTVEVTVKSDKYNNIWQVGTYNTTVTLK